MALPTEGILLSVTKEGKKKKVRHKMPSLNKRFTISGPDSNELAV